MLVDLSLQNRQYARESLAAPGAFAGTAAVRCDVPSLGQSSCETDFHWATTLDCAKKSTQTSEPSTPTTQRVAVQQMLVDLSALYRTGNIAIPTTFTTISTRELQQRIALDRPRPSKVRTLGPLRLAISTHVGPLRPPISTF